MKKLMLVCLLLVNVFTGMSVVSAEDKGFTDSRGVEVTLEQVPSKVVVLGYAEYDTLRELGLETSIIGAPTTNTPKYIGEIPASIQDIGSLKEPNLEVIAELAPDLIIANGRTAELAEELEKIAPTFVLSIDTKNYWESFSSQQMALASLFEKEAETATILSELEAQIAAVNEKNQSSEEKTLTLMLNEGNISVFSANSRFSLIYQVLGFKPVDSEIEDSRHGQEMSYEGILSVNPDRILYLDRTAAIGGDSSANQTFSENELLKQTTASQQNTITPLTSDLWYLGGGLQSVRLQIEELANLVK